MTMMLEDTKLGWEPRERNSDSAERPALDEMLEQTLHAKHDFWIQTLPSSSNGSSEGVYLSTFQKGRGQHLTTLTAEQARTLGLRLIWLAGKMEVSSAG